MNHNNTKKSKKKHVIMFGVLITLICVIIGTVTQEGDKVEDIYYVGFIIGLVTIIVGCCTKSQKKVDEEKELADIEFDVTKNIDNYLYLDEKRGKICIPTGLIKKKIDPFKIFNYTDVLNYELLEDGNSISKGGVGRALVGGALFGGVGAIVGGSTGHKNKQTCTRLQIKITNNNIEHPTEYINFIIGEVRKDSFTYKNAYNSAQKVLSTFDIICNSNSKKDENNSKLSSNAKSIPQQIKEYKELLDMGAITEEEYKVKKKEILDIK